VTDILLFSPLILAYGFILFAASKTGEDLLSAPFRDKEEAKK